MKKTIALLLALGFALLTQAQIATNYLINVSTFGGQTNLLREVSLQAEYWQASSSTFYINPVQTINVQTWPAITNGFVIFSNMLAGVPYVVTIGESWQNQRWNWSTNFMAPTNAAGPGGYVNAAPWVGQYVSPTNFLYPFPSSNSFALGYPVMGSNGAPAVMGLGIDAAGNSTTNAWASGGGGIPLGSGTNTTVRTVTGTNYIDVTSVNNATNIAVSLGGVWGEVVSVANPANGAPQALALAPISYGPSSVTNSGNLVVQGSIIGTNGIYMVDNAGNVTAKSVASATTFTGNGVNLTNVNVTTNVSIAALLADPTQNSPHYVVSYYGTNDLHGNAWGGGYFVYIPTSLTNNMQTNFGTIFQSQSGGFWNRVVDNPAVMHLDWFGVTSRNAASTAHVWDNTVQIQNAVDTTPDYGILLVPDQPYGAQSINISNRSQVTIKAITETHGQRNGLSGAGFFYCGSVQTNTFLTMYNCNGCTLDGLEINTAPFTPQTSASYTTNVALTAVDLDQLPGYLANCTDCKILNCAIDNFGATNTPNWIGVRNSRISQANCEFLQIRDTVFNGGNDPLTNQYGFYTNNGTAIVLSGNVNSFNNQFSHLESINVNTLIKSTNGSFTLDGALTEQSVCDFILPGNAGAIDIANVRSESPMQFAQLGSGRNAFIFRDNAVDGQLNGMPPLIQCTTNSAGAGISLMLIGNSWGVGTNQQILNFSGYVQVNLQSLGNQALHVSSTNMGYFSAQSIPINEFIYNIFDLVGGNVPFQASSFPMTAAIPNNGGNTNWYIWASNSPSALTLYPPYGSVAGNGFSIGTNSILTAGAFSGNGSNLTGVLDPTKMPTNNGTMFNPTSYGNLIMHTNLVSGGNQLAGHNGWTDYLYDPADNFYVGFGINANNGADNNTFAFTMSSNLPIAFFRQSEVDVWVGQTNDRGIAVFPVTGGTADPLSVSLTNNRSAHGWWVSTNYATFSPGGIWAGANSAGSIDANGQHNGNGAGLTNIPASGVIGTALTNVAASAASTNVPGTDQNGHQVTIPWSGLPAGGGGGGNASTNVAQAWPAAQTFTQPAYFTNNGTTASTVIASNLITTKTVQFGTGNNDVFLSPSGDTIVEGTSTGLPTGTLSVSNLNATGTFTGNGSGITNLPTASLSGTGIAITSSNLTSILVSNVPPLFSNASIVGMPTAGGVGFGYYSGAAANSYYGFPFQQFIAALAYNPSLTNLVLRAGINFTNTSSLIYIASIAEVFTNNPSGGPGGFYLVTVNTNVPTSLGPTNIQQVAYSLAIPYSMLTNCQGLTMRFSNNSTSITNYTLSYLLLGNE